MDSLFTQLGINGKLLLAQGLNFLVVLSVLTVFVYKPLIKLTEERRKKIELGLRGAEEVEKRLVEADAAKEERIREADITALKIVSAAENDAKKRSEIIVAAAENKAESVVKEAAEVADRRKEEELRRLYGIAGALVKDAIARTVELEPGQIDEKLVNQAVDLLKKTPRS